MGYSNIILLIHNKRRKKSLRHSTSINPHFTKEDLEEMSPPAIALIFSFYLGKF